MDYIRSVAARYLDNWVEVSEAFLSGSRIPALRLKSGYTAHHGPADTAIDLLYEIFVQQAYTPDHFYVPGPGDTILDCGANIGMFALYLCSAAPDIRVHCFEPAAENLILLTQNVVTNGLEKQIAIHPFAVFDRDATIQLRTGRSNGEYSLFERKTTTASSNYQTVECVSLDTALQICGVTDLNLLKLDVEAAEIEILEGASHLDWKRIKRVVLEYHDFMRPECREKSCRALEAYGFRTEVVPGMSPNIGVIRAWRQ